MGASKLHFYTDHQIEIARLCKALGHPARVAIVEKLIDNENLNCNDLRFYIPLAQSTISRHLKELFEAGILGYKVIGSNSYYYIHREVVKELKNYLKQVYLKTNIDLNYNNIYFRPRLNHRKPYFMRI